MEECEENIIMKPRWRDGKKTDNGKAYVGSRPNEMLDTDTTDDDDDKST